jgi:hypothetical protein
LKKFSVLLCGLLLLLFASGANAALTTIGTAYFNGAGPEYNLIWDNDNNGNSVVWLDYTNDRINWSDQNAWAAELDSALTINLSADYTVDWGTNSWRLPSTVDGLYVNSYTGNTTAGYNITTSEMGHLYYTELDNKGYYGTNGVNPQPGFGLNNTGDFNNLIADVYWSGTEYAVYPQYKEAWHFVMLNGRQTINSKTAASYGLAVRTAQVSSVPLPGALWLLGSGLIGLAGFRRKKQK